MIRWADLYAKLRADIAASAATGALAAGALWALDYAGALGTDPADRAAAAAILAWAGGKIAAYMRVETHPAGPGQLPAPAPSPPREGTTARD